MKKVPFFLLLALCALPLGAGNPFLAPQSSSAPRTSSSSGTVPDFLVDLQANFRNSTADLINKWKSDPGLGVLLPLVLITFLYGLIHALAPGHQKSVVFSLFLGRKEPLWKPIAAGFLTAGVHTGSSLALVGVLSLVQNSVAGLVKIEEGSRWMEWTAAALLGVLALSLIVRKVYHLIAHRGHHHHHGVAWKGGSLWGIVAAASLVPCSGATMVLLLALYTDLVGLGILSVAAISLGMGLVVAGAGLLAWSGREALFQKLKGRDHWISGLSEGLELVSYLILLVMALLVLV